MKNLPEKIKNLEKIKKIISVPKYIFFNNLEYKKNKKLIFKKINKNFNNLIIVRSSSFLEDNQISNAGRFLSIPNISPKNEKQLESAIEKVFNSYTKNKNSLNQFIIIQEFINNAKQVGVIFSANSSNGLPFRTINYNNSKNTSLITSGKTNGRIINYYKDLSKNYLNKEVYKLEKIICNLEKIFPKQQLDIEFLIFKKKIMILQVRRLYTKKKININYKKTLKDLEKKIVKMNEEKISLFGKNRYFSTMTDWNPAEIIGLKPKPLALTMYKSLITDNVWGESRNDLGYKYVKGLPLLFNFLGTPYIDIKTDFNSFLSPKISESNQKKLISFYLKEFKKKPYFYHDKVESSLVINCCSLNTKKYKNILLRSTLKKNEINNILSVYKKLTEEIILKLNKNISLYKKGLKLFKNIKKSKTKSINKIYLLHNLCKNYGTLPFANIARMAFIGIEFLNSMVELNIINNNEKEHFLENLNSISYEMNQALNKKNKKLFFEKFGHLRPNTYEISNPNYKENFSRYFLKNKKKKIIEKKIKFEKNKKNLINKFLDKEGFSKLNADILLNFIKSSIKEREASKLFFTKIIDEIFSELKVFAKRIKLKENYIQYLDINDVLSYYNNFSHEYLIKNLKRKSIENKKTYFYCQNLSLPNIILSKNDIYFFEERKASPTFITTKEIISEFKYIKKDFKNINLKNKIICIENADPGFDFIFNHDIRGLITAFGGPNSHMSIRCNEFSLPAAIGIGEKKFQQLINKNSIYLNCEKKILSAS